MVKNILITGGTGFVGKHLVEQLIKEKHNVLELVRDLERNNSYHNRVLYEDEFLEQKIIDFNPNIVIHLASYLTSSDSLKDISELIDSNISLISRLLKILIKTKIELFVNTGSFAEYKDGNDELIPAYFYSATKTASRFIIDYFSTSYKFSYCTVVPYSIYGENDSQKKVIDYIFDSIDSETAVKMSPGNQILDFIHVSDIVDFYMLLIKKYNKVENKSSFKIGTGIGTSIKELANIIESVTGKKTNIKWGALKYRVNDVMYAVSPGFIVIDNVRWFAKIKLDNGIRKFIR